jgi:hypothetical protein
VRVPVHRNWILSMRMAHPFLAKLTLQPELLRLVNRCGMW